MHDLRLEQRDPIAGKGAAEICQAEQEHALVEQRLLQAVVPDGLALGSFGAQPRHQPIALRLCQPVRVRRPVGHIEPEYHAQNDCRRSLHDEQPLPAGNAEPAVEIEQEAGDQGAQDVGKRDCRHEDADDPGPVVRREPPGQVKDDAGKEAGLGNAEHEAERIEGRWSGDECGAAGYDAPGDQDPRDPHPRADLAQQDVAGHFEDEVADEEYAAAETIDSGGETQHLVHGEGGEADIHPVEIGDEVACDQHRQQPAGDARHGLAFNVGDLVGQSGSLCCVVHVVSSSYQPGRADSRTFAAMVAGQRGKARGGGHWRLRRRQPLARAPRAFRIWQ